ncbi:MAG: hypothetical protein V7643_1886 [Mycobacterium sp.]|jgi:hypothetical protein
MFASSMQLLMRVWLGISCLLPDHAAWPYPPR